MSLYTVLHNLALGLAGAYIVFQLHQLRKAQHMAQNKIDELAVSLERIHHEIVAEISSLKDQIAGGVQPAELDWSRLDAAVGNLDAVAPEITEDEPADDEVDPDFGVDHEPAE